MAGFKVRPWAEKSMAQNTPEVDWFKLSALR